MPIPALVWLIVQVALIALSILLAPKPKLENAKPHGLGDFQFPTATEGRPVPIVWGTARIKGPNVVWFGDLKTKKITEKIPTGFFSSKNITVGHVYRVGIDFAICEGPVNGLLGIEVANKPVADRVFGAVTDPGGANTGNGKLVLYSAKAGSPPQTWTFQCTTGGLFAVFSVTGSVSGSQPSLLVNSKYSNAHLSCEIKNGSTGFVVGDNFQVTTQAGPYGGAGDVNGVSLNIAKANLFGGRKKGGGLVGTLQFYDGVANQAKDSYLTSVLGTDVPGYVNVCHAVWRRGEIGESTSMDAWAFEVQRFPDNLGLTGSNHIVNGGDANPAEVIYELMTNQRWGLGIQTSEFNLASFQSAGNTLFTEGNGFSFVLDRETKVEDLIQEVLNQIDGLLYQDVDGKFTLALARQDYVLGSTPVLDETNILELREFTRGSWAETYNDVSVKFNDRTDDYKETFAMGQDLANFEIQGMKRSLVVSYPGVKHPTTARQVAMRELKFNAFPHARASVVVDRSMNTLRPGAVVRFSWSNLGINTLPMRVVDVDFGELLDGRIRMELVQDIFGVAEASFAAPPGTGWDAVDGTALAATAQRVFDSPYFLILIDQTLQGAAGERAITVAGRPNSAHEQFRMFVDASDGSGYLETGASGPAGFTPTGTLNAAYPEDTADIETSGLLVVASPLDFDDLAIASASEIETYGYNLILVDDEIMAFEQAIDNGDGTWTLLNVHRGMLDTLPAAHAMGARVYCFAAGAAASSTTYSGTASINAKVVTETKSDQLGIDQATALPITFARRAEKPLPAGSFKVNTKRYPVIEPVGDLALTWAHRNRQDPKALDQNDVDSSLGLPASHQYRITFWNYNNGVQGSQLREVTQSTTGYTYTSANQVADNGGAQPQAIQMRVRTENTALGLNNLQDVFRVVEVFDVQPNSIDLDGSTESLLSTTSTLGFANTWTIALWLKREDADTVVRTYLDVREAAGNINRVIISRKAGTSDTLRVEVYDSAGTLFKDHEFSGQLPANAWTHVVVAFDGAEANDPLRVYVGGAIRTPSATPTNTTGTMTDTSRLVEVPATFDGRLHAIAAWNVELTAAEVSAIFAAGNGSDFNLNYDKNGYVSRGSLRHWWRLGHDSSPDADIGKDYALSPSPAAINLMDAAANVTAADVVADAP